MKGLSLICIGKHVRLRIILARIFMEQKTIRAVWTENTIRIYQAYNHFIASEAVRLGTFGTSFKRNRMTWIKPSFLWMMYRSGWATKENQEHILAIDLKRSGFDYLIENAVPSTFDDKMDISKEEWQYKIKNADVVCQWDPERDVWGNPLECRSIQIGIRGNALDNFINEWIVEVKDISENVNKLKSMLDNNMDITDLLPNESVYSIYSNT